MLSLRIQECLCRCVNTVKNTGVASAFAAAEREKHLDNISTSWYFRYQIRRSHTDGARCLLPMLLHSRCVSKKY